MNGFSAQWLQLREPLDAASRAEGLCTFLADDLALKQRPESRLAVIDLGAGTGANLRYVAPRLGGRQDWVLVEHDPLLLEALEGRMRAWAPKFECRVRHVALDLATQLHELLLPSGVLITASALLDLVSESWLHSLALRAAAAAAPIWFALTYNGRMECMPPEPEDSEVGELVNLHQLHDKGFGPALGPGAAQMAQNIFSEHGYLVRSAPSDWRIGPKDRELQLALIEGWFDAASEVAPHRAAALSSWLARRRAHIEAGRSELRIGHVDLVGRLQAR